MNLKELDSFKISDAITFHDKLNPKLWNGTKLRPEVKQQLEAIADDFLQEMGIHDLDVRDITVSGSNAAYSYTNHSDLDLHILVNISDLPHSEIYKELFHAKKTLYNDTHDITIHRVPIELYVQDASEPVVSLGEYSIKNDEWLKIPTKRRANFDQNATKAKYEKLLDIVKQAIASNNLNKIQKVLKKIKQYRQAGLDKGGEFGPENLAFKALRSQGYITKLYDLRDKLHSHRLSIEGMYSNMDEDYDPNGPPPGPEFPPTMPAGTVKVDVSDVYDWYKLGQHISNMKGLGKHDFGSGPPSTILSFGDEDTEHKYIKDLEKTGLTTTDIDPVDPKQPKGMKRQKTDPTYNVNEAFDQPYKLKWEKGDHGDVDAIAKMDDGNYLSIMFNKGYSQGSKEEAWSVEFFRNNSQEVTGEGDAQRVFATVLSAIQTFIKKYKPNRVIFSASKEVEQGQNAQSRARLYDSLVQRYAKAWGFRAFRADTGDKVIYELNRIQPVKEDAETTTEHYNGIEISLEKEDDEVMVTAMMANGREMGHVLFIQEGDYLMPQDLEVEERYQGQGIAATMYDYVKSKGYKIRRSGQQTDAGAGFWNKHRPEQNVWEDDTMQYASEKTSATNPYGGQRDRQYRGSISEAPIIGNYADLYHTAWTDTGSLDSILQSGKLIPGQNKWLSLTRDSRLDYAKMMGQFAEFVIDQNKLRQRVKLDQYDDFKGRGDDEAEERVNVPIPLKGYVKSIHLPASWKHNEQAMQYYEPKLKQYGIPFYYDTMGSPEDRNADVPRLEESSGYIPSEKERNDPRFKTALTVDVKPDSIKKNAKAFAWLTDRAGIPPTAKANGKV